MHKNAQDVFVESLNQKINVILKFAFYEKKQKQKKTLFFFRKFILLVLTSVFSGYDYEPIPNRDDKRHNIGKFILFFLCA